MIHEHLRPSYEPRKFYGPLQRDSEMPQPLDRHFMLHPDDPSKLVRFSSGNAIDFVDEEDMNEKVASIQRVLAGLARHGIPHVNPTYVNETDGNRPNLLMIVDRLNNAHPYDEIVDSGNLSPQIASEADLVLCRLLEYTGMALREGDYIDAEMMRLDQFAYDDSRPVGQKMVLIDVEPLGASRVEPTAESIEQGSTEGFPTDATRTIARLSIDAIELAQKTDHPLKSLRAAASVVEALPGNSPQTNEAKAVLLRALDTREVSQEVFNLAMGEKMDSDFWIYGDE